MLTKENIAYTVSLFLFLFAIVIIILLSLTLIGLAASIVLVLTGVGIIYYVRIKTRTQPLPTKTPEKHIRIQEISVRELKKWFKNEIQTIIEPLNAEGERLLAETKSKINEVQKTCNEAVKASEEEIQRNEKPHKARGMRKVARYLLEVIQDIKVPEKVSFKSLNELSTDLKETLNAAGQARATWFPLISPMFILVRRKIDSGFGEIADLFKNLKSFLSTEYSKAKKIEDTFLMIDEISGSLDDLEKEIEKTKATELTVEKLTKNIKDHKQKINEIKKGSKIASLNAVKNEVNKLNKKVKHSLRRLRKPLMKLKHSHLSTESSFSSIDTPRLTDYLSNPFLALTAEEEGYPILKKILLVLNTAMKQRKLNLKGSRVRKAQEEITKIVNRDSLLSLQKRCKEALLRQKELQSSSQVRRLQKEHTRLKKRLKKLQKRREISVSRMESQKSKHMENQKKIEDQKKQIEKNVRETTGKNLKILL